ncbi:MAG TPA: hypothetical protein VM096_07525 [Vicinamibacterales bacterium]|nr:hypothetical protein [Vicinamibacterales bacterium]
MPSKIPLVRRVLRTAVVPFALLLAVVTVAADGPVNTVASVTQVNDTDSGSGERWGRAGGRNLTFSVGDTSAMATLFWGATQAPSAAFDNNVNAGEVMIFDPSSNLGGGIARWTGTATLPLFNGSSVAVPTRFTLTTSAALSNNAGGATPGLNVKSVNGFTANLLFEAQVVPGLVGTVGQWVPMLEFYDAQQTPTGNPQGTTGPVLTSFNRGFFYTNANTGMTVDQHDLNEIARFTTLQGTANQIKDGTEFLRIEVPGRLGPIGSDVATIKSNVQQLLQNPPGQIPQDIAKRSDVQSAKEDINEILMILIGLKPCPLSPEDCAGLTFMPQVAKQTSADQIQQKVDTLATQASVDQVRQALNGLATGVDIETLVQLVMAESARDSVNDLKQMLADMRAVLEQKKTARLQVQVVELTEADPAHRRRWLLRTSIHGAAASADLSKLVAITVDKKKPTTTTDVTTMAAVSQLMPGLMEVVLDVSKPNLTDVAFQFKVAHIDGSETMHATTLVGDVKK